jgi:uncharacterized Zn finger protein
MTEETLKEACISGGVLLRLIEEKDTHIVVECEKCGKVFDVDRSR